MWQRRSSATPNFVYRSGDQAETLRIVHVAGRNGALERLETLEGQAREIVRSGDEVKCYLPGSMTVKVDRHTDRMVFPALLPANLQDISEHYEVSKGAIERIAGYDCQAIVLQPKDKLRYGHRLWADANTGMLLKSQTLDERNEVVEQFAFTQIRIGGRITTTSSGPGSGAIARLACRELVPSCCLTRPVDDQAGAARLQENDRDDAPRAGRTKSGMWSIPMAWPRSRYSSSPWPTRPRCRRPGCRARVRSTSTAGKSPVIW
jgi:outer membrane lipoprotein-sorting protein